MLQYLLALLLQTAARSASKPVSPFEWSPTFRLSLRTIPVKIVCTAVRLWMMRFSNDRKQLKPQIQPTTQGCHPPRPTYASVIAVVLWQINLLRAGRQVAGEKSNQVTLVQVGAAGLMRMTTLRPNPAARKGTGHRALRAGPADA